jgi:hypothetical protein
MLPQVAEEMVQVEVGLGNPDVQAQIHPRVAGGPAEMV